MIRFCLDAGLPEPAFEDQKIAFIVRFQKFFITDTVLSQLNERQRQAIEHLKEVRRITTAEYADRFGVSTRTARNDVRQLVDLGILQRKGESDKTTYYEFRGNFAEISRK